MTLECYDRLRGLKMGKYAPISRRWFPWRCPASAVGLLELFPLLSQLGKLVVNQFCRKLNTVKRNFFGSYSCLGLLAPGASFSRVT